MKYFRLADKAYRETVDLRLYEDDIAAAVAKVKPDAQLFVEQDGFYTIPELGKRESILVSQQLRQNSGLNEYVTYQKVSEAKRLLSDGTRKVYEVADLLGFESAFYFSKVFSVCSITPFYFEQCF